MFDFFGRKAKKEVERLKKENKRILRENEELQRKAKEADENQAIADAIMGRSSKKTTDIMGTNELLAKLGIDRAYYNSLPWLERRKVRKKMEEISGKKWYQYYDINFQSQNEWAEKMYVKKKY